MERQARTNSSSSSTSSSRRSSDSDSSSGRPSSTRLLKVKKKRKVHHWSQCRCRSKRVEERNRHKIRIAGRRSRSRCKYSIKRCHWHDKSARNESEECSDDSRQESSMKNSIEDQKLKQIDRNYNLAPCHSLRCGCMNRQEGEDLSRIYYKRRRKKHNFSHSMHRDFLSCRDDGYCRRCFGSGFEKGFNREQTSRMFLQKHQHHKDWDAYDVQSPPVLNRGSDIEAISRFGRQELVQEMIAETRMGRTLSALDSAIKGRNEKDWLLLSLDRAKAASPSVKDCERDDFKLCLPGYSRSEMSTVVEEFDLNVAIDEDYGAMENSTPLQLPPPPCCKIEVPSAVQSPGSPPGELLHHGVINEPFWIEETKNDSLAKQHVNDCSSVAISSQIRGDNIILLDSSEDEDTQVEDGHSKLMKCLRSPKLEPNCSEHTSSNAERGVSKSLEDSAPYGNLPANTVKAERSPESLQTAEGEVVDTDGAACGHEDAMAIYDVNRLHGKDEERETVENGSAMSIVLADDGLTEKPGQDLNVSCETPKGDLNGFKARRKRIVQRPSLPLQEPVECHENVVPETAIQGDLIVQKAFLNKMIIAKSQMWDANILCDLCHKGPSLFLGEWFSWCCGVFLSKCHCPPELQMKLKSGMRNRKNNKAKKNEELSWSGKVHKMCALWSSEVFEEDEGDSLQRVLDAVRRGRLLTCAGCKDYGATLGCRVKNCHRSYHYPCADRLASKFQCRMWDGVQFPVACHGHRHVEQSCLNAKEKVPDLKNWKKKGSIQRKKVIMSFEKLLDTEQGILAHARLFKDGQEKEKMDCFLGSRSIVPRNVLADGEEKIVKMKSRVLVIDLSSDSEITNKENLFSGERANNYVKGDSVEAVFNADRVCNQELEVSRHEDTTSNLYFMGDNLLNNDISGGHEEVTIPCTNDVDADPAPEIVYITRNRYLEKTRNILGALLMDGEYFARSCEGCDNFDIDDPHEEVSTHVFLLNGHRESDTRMDWQGQPMLGRLPYDRYGRLQLGPYTNDVIECNSRCPCGLNCVNKDLQKGLKTPLEVFKTKDRGWGVRTMKQIPRGKFVVEYVGEILTYSEAKERAMTYDSSNISCLFSMDHPELSVDKCFVVDGFNMSNVARFINHSCEGNLRIYRVYAEISDLRFCRIGMYAGRDIEIGEELTYNYCNSNRWDMDEIALSENRAAIKCYCGSKKCRQWL